MKTLGLVMFVLLSGNISIYASYTCYFDYWGRVNDYVLLLRTGNLTQAGYNILVAHAVRDFYDCYGYTPAP